MAQPAFENTQTIFMTGLSILLSLFIILVLIKIPALIYLIQALTRFFHSIITFIITAKPVFFFLWSTITAIYVYFFIMLGVLVFSWGFRYGLESIIRLLGRLLFHLDLTFILPIIYFPGAILKQSIMVITARLVNLETGLNFSMTLSRDVSSLSIRHTSDRQFASIAVSSSPLVNLLILYGLFFFHPSTLLFILDQNALPLLEFLRWYFFLSILTAGLPNSQNIMYILQSFIQLNPWLIPLILWGLISAWFTYMALGKFWSSFFFIIYLTTLLIYEIRDYHQKPTVTEEDIQVLLEE